SQVPVPLKANEDDVGRIFDLLMSHYKYVVVDASSRLDMLVRIVGNLSDSVLMVAETDIIALLWNAARVQSFLGEAGREKVPLVRVVPGTTDQRLLWRAVRYGLQPGREVAGTCRWSPQRRAPYFQTAVPAAGMSIQRLPTSAIRTTASAATTYGGWITR